MEDVKSEQHQADGPEQVARAPPTGPGHRRGKSKRARSPLCWPWPKQHTGRFSDAAIRHRAQRARAHTQRHTHGERTRAALGAGGPLRSRVGPSTCAAHAGAAAAAATGRSVFVVARQQPSHGKRHRGPPSNAAPPRAPEPNQPRRQQRRRKPKLRRASAAARAERAGNETHSVGVSSPSSRQLQTRRPEETRNRTMKNRLSVYSFFQPGEMKINLSAKPQFLMFLH